MSENTIRSVRVRASELEGRAWLNTGDKNLTLQDLRGKIVILDFWTLCCINCLHVLDELRPLEEEFSDVLVTVGVHSPKFEHEADPVALAAAVDRYHITHPVLDDPELTTWQAYTARAWPTLVVVDPEGYIRILQVAADLNTVINTYGGGDDPVNHPVKGHVDGTATEARFNEPAGLALVPENLREQLGYDVLVADTVNHRLRSLNLSTGEVRTLAGNGVQRVIDGENTITGDPNHIPAGVPATEIALSSPWDAVYSREAGQFIIAMASSQAPASKASPTAPPPTHGSPSPPASSKHATAASGSHAPKPAACATSLSPKTAYRSPPPLAKACSTSASSTVTPTPPACSTPSV